MGNNGCAVYASYPVIYPDRLPRRSLEKTGNRRGTILPAGYHLYNMVQDLSEARCFYDDKFAAFGYRNVICCKWKI